MSLAYLLLWLEWPEGSQGLLRTWTKFEGEDLCGPLEMEGVLSRWAAAERGMKLEDWMGRNWGRGKDLQ